MFPPSRFYVSLAPRETDDLNYETFGESMPSDNGFTQLASDRSKIYHFLLIDGQIAFIDKPMNGFRYGLWSVTESFSNTRLYG